MTFGYDARSFITPFQKTTTSRIFTFGEELLGQLKDVRGKREERNRPVIFVAHSLGGIVVKSVSAGLQIHPAQSKFMDL